MHVFVVEVLLWWFFIFFCCESCKAIVVDIDSQWITTGNQNINPEIKL
jgi:hypothetical protein